MLLSDQSILRMNSRTAPERQNEARRSVAKPRALLRRVSLSRLQETPVAHRSESRARGNDHVVENRNAQ